jgi:putative N6-adenine-specific DNA methylase
MKWYAVAHPGLEPVVARELAILGVTGTLAPGGVRFEATLEQGAALLPRLRTPSRLLLELVEGPVNATEQLVSLTRRVQWKTYLPPDAQIDVSASIKTSRIHFRESAEKKVLHHIREALKGPRVVERTRKPTVPQRVALRVEEDRATLSLDAGGGELLHFRGWRTEQGPASLRENLAAAMLYAAGWTGDEALVDPFCGSGTLPIEAALLASARSPFVRRVFAADEWPALQKQKAATTVPSPITVPILGYDRDGRVLKAAVANAKRAGVTVQFEQREVADLGPPGPRGLVIANPPYGKRLGEGSEGRAYAEFGETLRGRFEGWRVLFLSPDAGLAAKVHRDAERLLFFSNGGVRVGMYALEVR